MQYSSWTNIEGRIFRASLTDREAGHHYSAQHLNLYQARECLEQARRQANDARERKGIPRTGLPD